MGFGWTKKGEFLVPFADGRRIAKLHMHNQLAAAL